MAQGPQTMGPQQQSQNSAKTISMLADSGSVLEVAAVFLS